MNSATCLPLVVSFPVNFCLFIYLLIFFFSSRRRHTRWNCDWSSDVCSSDLQDLHGDVLAATDPGGLDEARVRAAAAGFVGESLQVPPMVSARKVGGQRLYRLDRKSVV